VKALLLSYESVQSFATDYEHNLRKGRAFVSGADGLAERDRCTLKIVIPESGAEVGLSAEAVWIGPAGIGLAFVDFDAAAKAKLDEMAKLAEAENDDGEERDEGNDTSDVGAAGAPRRMGPRNLYERMRNLTISQREEMARHGALAERVALERAFGGVVWEGLLQNPSISSAEVARIARHGTLPKPLVNIIVNNPGWLSVPEVQRALMTNPRCSGPHLERVVRSIDHHELTRLAQNCPYRSEVRNFVRQFATRRR
jgi:hypothetical protein